MKNLFNDQDFQQLNEDINWNKNRQELIRQNLFQKARKIEKKSKAYHYLMVTASVTLFFIAVFIGSQFLFNKDNEQINPPVVSDEQEHLEEKDNNDQEEVENNEEELNEELDESTEDSSKEEEQNQNENEIDSVVYKGIYDESKQYFSVAMSDDNAMYTIPVTIPSINLESLDNLNFHADPMLKEYLLENYLIVPARSDIPLQSYHYDEENKHVSLYFNKQDLINVQGSTGMMLAGYAFHVYARQIVPEAEYFTVFEDDKPFMDSHGGSHEHVTIVRNNVYTPVNTGKQIFLKEETNVYETVEQYIESFLSLHDRPDLPEATVDLSMFSLSYTGYSGNSIEIKITGEVGNMTETERANLQTLISHGIGLTIFHSPHYFSERVNEATIFLNDEVIFDGSLDAIQINVIDVDLQS
ncbi:MULTISPECIES: hypothetical protein [Sutcliffiella]|uniref:Uncharacterized protein n=1 Tax=Sutcliffiella cohnii TaxID=33932 RepID=A0A223KQ02_9BACI|nr:MULTISPECIES: hypothetical protein [Sutcliffiella]AST91486.1 hypothetical protein BC6307_09430 [Sutcliffiella cohnii]MED4014948.1 hypothetical protein [Sutcliffiella cohnii]WBL17318.1 hypothetical protein O1A01_12070 [Sutcliffiella sp. NC1]